MVPYLRPDMIKVLDSGHLFRPPVVAFGPTFLVGRHGSPEEKHVFAVWQGQD